MQAGGCLEEEAGRKCSIQMCIPGNSDPSRLSELTYSGVPGTLYDTG